MNAQLGEFATVRTGLVLSRKKAEPDFEQSRVYEQVSMRCFDSSVKIDKEHIDAFNAVENIDSRYLTQKGDVLLRLRAPSSAVYIAKEDEGLLISSLLAVIRVDDAKVDAKYLAYYINSKASQRILKQETKGTAIPMLKTKDLENLEVVLPSLVKQKELVRFLELADKEKDLLQKLIDEKQKLSQTILDTIIQQNKEDK